MKILCKITTLFSLTLYSLFLRAHFQLSNTQLLEIGNKIWRNECNNSLEKLTSWKQYEQWPSLGIAHFIWYPQSVQAPFTQTFPELIKFLSSRNIKIPRWLTLACPWQTREEFLHDFESMRMKELRELLKNTIKEQMEFIAYQFMNHKQQLLQSAHFSKKDHVAQIFDKLTSLDSGLYALIDYANFKGFGVNPQERYEGQGWGLLQVLENMPYQQNSSQCLDSFVQSAKTLLIQRVAHAPLNKPEKQWLHGWINRINTYQN